MLHAAPLRSGAAGGNRPSGSSQAKRSVRGVGIQGTDLVLRLSTPTSEDVEHDVGAAHAASERLGTGGLHRRQPIRQHGGEDLDHLPVAEARGRASL